MTTDDETKLRRIIFETLRGMRLKNDDTGREIAKAAIHKAIREAESRGEFDEAPPARLEITRDPHDPSKLWVGVPRK